MDEETRKILRQISREEMYELWGRAKERNYEGLNDEKQRIAKIMVEHEDEFHNQLEFADLTYDHDYDPDTEYNPFLHITIHFVGQILSCLIFDVMKYKKPFNSELYRKLLKKYKTRNPEKLMDLLESDRLLPD